MVNAIGIVAFRPSMEVYERVHSLVGAGFEVYLFANCQESYSKFSPHSDSLNLLGSGSNIGLSKAFNLVAKAALDDGFQGLLILDQDTQIVSFDRLHELMSFKLPAFCGAVSFLTRETSQEQEIFGALRFLGGGFSRIDLLINSGTIFSLNALREIGFFPHHFFVECVDYYVSIKIKTMGYKPLRYNGEPIFDHDAEQEGRVAVFFGKRILIRNYGWRRLLDFFSGMLKCLEMALRQKQYKVFFILVRSSVVFLLSNLLASIGGKNEGSARNSDTRV